MDKFWLCLDLQVPLELTTVLGKIRVIDAFDKHFPLRQLHLQHLHKALNPALWIYRL